MHVTANTFLGRLKYNYWSVTIFKFRFVFLNNYKIHNYDIMIISSHEQGVHKFFKKT